MSYGSLQRKSATIEGPRLRTQRGLKNWYWGFRGSGVKVMIPLICKTDTGETVFKRHLKTKVLETVFGENCI